MLIGRTKPLDLAKRVLQPATLSSVRECQELHLRGWMILDRWAFDQPEKLRELENSGEVALLGRVLEQQALEHAVLMDATAALNSGTSEREILTMNHVQMDLR